MSLRTLGASILGNLLARKCKIRAGKDTITTHKGTIRAHEGTVRASQDF